MLTGVKKDYKVCSQRNKKDERHFYHAILASRSASRQLLYKNITRNNDI